MYVNSLRSSASIDGSRQEVGQPPGANPSPFSLELKCFGLPPSNYSPICSATPGLRLKGPNEPLKGSMSVALEFQTYRARVRATIPNRVPRATWTWRPPARSRMASLHVIQRGQFDGDIEPDPFLWRRRQRNVIRHRCNGRPVAPHDFDVVVPGDRDGEPNRQLGFSRRSQLLRSDLGTCRHPRASHTCVATCFAASLFGVLPHHTHTVGVDHVSRTSVPID
jgi:hypothetical protein